MPQQVAGRSPAVVTAVLALCGTATSLQQTMLLPVLPDLPRLLSTSPENASWLVTATLLTGAVATPVISRLADMRGKRQLMLTCLAAMVAGSLLGALSRSLPSVLAARALQGVGMALLPVGIAAMRDQLPTHRLPMGVALMSTTMAIGAGAGPPLSGLVVRYFEWHAIFWLSAALGAAMLVLIRLVVSASGPKAGGRFDYPGAVLLSGGLTAALLAMSKGGSWGWSSVTTVATAAAGLLLIALWLPVQLVVRHPLVDVRTAARPAVLVVNVVAVLLGFAMYTNSLITTQQLQQPTSSGYGLGLDVLQTGLWLVPAMVVFGAMAPVAAMITRRFDARVTLIAGAASLALAWACRAPFSNSLWQVVGGSMLVSVGTSMAFAAMPTLIMSAVPVTQTASANGLNTLLRSVGTSTSSAATAGVLALGVHSVAGKAVPSFGAVVAVFWMAAAASAAAVLIVLPLFRIGRRDPPPVPDVLVLTDPAGAVAGPAEHR